MKKKVLVALALVAMAVVAAKAEVAFSVSFGSYHYTPRHCYTPPPVCAPAPVVCAPAPVVYAPAPATYMPRVVYTPPVFYSSPVYCTPRVEHHWSPGFQARIPERNCAPSPYGGHGRSWHRAGW